MITQAYLSMSKPVSLCQVLWIDEAYLQTPVSSSDGTTTQAAARPQQTAPDASFATEVIILLINMTVTHLLIAIFSY